MNNMKPLKRFKKPVPKGTKRNKDKEAERFYRPGLLEFLKAKLLNNKEI